MSVDFSYLKMTTAEIQEIQIKHDLALEGINSDINSDEFIPKMFERAKANFANGGNFSYTEKFIPYDRESKKLFNKMLQYVDCGLRNALQSKFSKIHEKLIVKVSTTCNLLDSVLAINITCSIDKEYL